MSWTPFLPRSTLWNREGFPLQTHIDLVRALFLAAFEAEEPFPQILSRALTECYQGLGWDLVLSKPKNQDITPKYPDLGNIQSCSGGSRKDWVW